MAITITVDPTFKDLNDDPSYKTKPGGLGREVTIVANVEITATTTYATGGITLDFKTAAGLRLRQVYLCYAKQGHSGFLIDFIPGSNNDAATGKLKFYGTDPGAVGGAIAALKELANGSTDIQGLTLKCVISGVK